MELSDFLNRRSALKIRLQRNLVTQSHGKHQWPVWPVWPVWVRVPLQSLNLQISHLFRARNPLIFEQLRVQIHSKRVCEMIKHTVNASYKQVPTTQLIHSASLAKRLSVRLRNMWL